MAVYRLKVEFTQSELTKKNTTFHNLNKAIAIAVAIVGYWCIPLHQLRT